MFRHRLTGGAELRLMERRHAEQIYTVVERNREYLRKWLPWVDKTHSAADTRAFIDSAIAQFADTNGLAAGIWVRGRFAGAIGMHAVDWNNCASSIGYWIDEAHQGRGLVTAACRAVLAYIFEDLKLNRVEIRAGVRNRKSRAIPVRLGFRKEGVLREAGWLGDRYTDLVVYSMLASEWQPEK